jgi:hypothetical protein
VGDTSGEQLPASSLDRGLPRKNERATLPCRSLHLKLGDEALGGNLHPGLSLGLKGTVPGGTPMRITNYMAAAAAMMLFVAGPAARAQTAGSTSGPAAGSPVAPNTAVQKENPANPASAEQAKEGVSPGAAVSAGSPGATAKEGTQGGPAPGSGVTQTTGGVSPGGAIGAGAPGSTARQGTQGGPAPNPAQSK